MKIAQKKHYAPTITLGLFPSQYVHFIVIQNVAYYASLFKGVYQNNKNLTNSAVPRDAQSSQFLDRHQQYAAYVCECRPTRCATRPHSNFLMLESNKDEHLQSLYSLYTPKCTCTLKHSNSMYDKLKCWTKRVHG